MLGHYKPKCPRLEYDVVGIRRFGDHLQNIGGFDEALKRREKTYWKNRAEGSKNETGAGTSGTAGGTTQLVKPRPVPLWIGQNFDKWKDEITTWNTNNRSSN